MREFSVQQHRKRALVRAPDKRNEKIAIFVHGFNGGFLKTWGELPELLVQHADGDPVLEEWDFLFIGYSTLGPAGIQEFSHISGLVGTELRNALRGDLAGRTGRPYRKAALFGHSLGTLGIRELVTSVAKLPDDALGSLTGIGFFGSPLNGSVLAHLGQWVAPIGAALRPGSREMQALRNAVTRAWNVRPWPEVQLVLGTEDMVVGPHLHRWDGDLDPPDHHAVDHSLICKPMDFEDVPVDIIRRCCHGR